ncbi:MAG: ATP-binding protein, partial [Gemmatimonadales bacterium]
GRLRQILTNLVGNALKFTREGAVRVRVVVLRPGEEIRFEVEDTGVGIPADRLDRVFEKYAQVDASTTRKFGGTGLGLTISRELLELMGGRMTVSSEPGKGSLFAFTLPLTACAGVPARLPRNVPLTGCRLLQIGLDGFAPPDRSTCLASAGLRVSEILSFQPPAEALLEAAEGREPYEVVLVDAERMSPRLEQAIMACRREGWPPVAIVVVIERGEPGVARRVHAAGAHACLFGAVAAEDLMEAITVARQVVQGRLTWPLITRPWLLEARFADTEGRPAQAAPSGPPRVFRALVTDDNELNRLVATEYLRRLGCEVETASSGATAIERVQRGGLDLVFMDCQMPDMDGYQTTARIRGLGGEAARLAIVAMTANAMQGDRERCLAAGMDDYVSKPIREADLARMLKRWAGARMTSAVDVPPEASQAEPATAVEAEALAGLIASGPGGAQLAERLIELFLRDAPDQIAAMGEALTGSDTAFAARLAHTLRGAAGVIGAYGIRDACLLIERALDQEALPEAWAGHARLEQEGSLALAALRESRTARAGAPPLDPEKLIEYLRMEAAMPGLLAEMVTVFLRDAPGRITALELALTTGNVELARNAAHALKGAALQLGALPLGDAAGALERAARDGSLENGQLHLQRIVAEFARAVPALEQHLSERQPSEVA